MLGWIAYLLHQQWLKEREFTHVIQQEQQARQERELLASTSNSPDIRSEIQSFGNLLGLVKKLAADELIEKNTGKELTQLLAEKLKMQLKAHFTNLDQKEAK